jgi:hypothetical protein
MSIQVVNRLLIGCIYSQDIERGDELGRGVVGKTMGNSQSGDCKQSIPISSLELGQPNTSKFWDSRRECERDIQIFI